MAVFEFVIGHCVSVKFMYALFILPIVKHEFCLMCEVELVHDILCGLCKHSLCFKVGYQALCTAIFERQPYCP